MTDIGVITDTSILPITGFRYGPVLYDMIEANVTLGTVA